MYFIDEFSNLLFEKWATNQFTLNITPKCWWPTRCWWPKTNIEERKKACYEAAQEKERQEWSVEVRVGTLNVGTGKRRQLKRR